MDVVDRMVDGYEIKHAIYIGNKEILFGMDETKPDAPYMVCDCTWDNPLGIDRYEKAVGSADYFEMMTEFLARAQAQLEAVKAERVETSISLFTKEHCTPNDYSQSIENKVVVIRPECLLPEYRTAVKQLVLTTGGFGTHGNARGRAVYTVNLYSGKEARWNREDILGVLKSEFLPDWAAEKLKQVCEKRRAKERREPER
jgi:hypothetical protein